MTNAQVLLETTSYSINEIAGIVGYNNPLYFSRLFHKQKGCSPSEYRAKIHNKRQKQEQMLLLYPDTYLFN